MSAPAFALLHGGGQGSWVWDQVIAALTASGARAVALDVPGCGTRRARATIALGVEEVADELLADMDSAGLRGAVLVGHSQAGTLLPVLVRRQSGQIGRLVYVSCCAPLPDQSVLDMMGHGRRGENPDEVGWPFDPDLHGKDEQRLAMFCNDMTDRQARAFLPCLDRDAWPMPVTLAVHWNYDHLAGVPSAYVVCDRDAILPPAWQERFAHRLHAQRILHIDAGHQVMNTRPGQLAALLMAAGVQAA
jgi:pimeloyl-ACP methyl ester carboxylesterase